MYDDKPVRFLERLHYEAHAKPESTSCCAGFEFSAWRCKQFADHLIEWLPEYALLEEELRVHHGNIFVKLQQAAVRVYTSDKHKNRGEVGEIALHAICREFFNTIPISPRVFYKSSSNDVVKAFDMVHAYFPAGNGVELWLGESKLYGDADAAIRDAISSVKLHLDQGFLRNQKLLLGPQIPKTTPRFAEILELFRPQASLDRFLSSAVFAVAVLAPSPAVAATTGHTRTYSEQVRAELQELVEKVVRSGLLHDIRIILIYVPVGNKPQLVDDFDARLKALQ